jgi:hypothetical protein
MNSLRLPAIENQWPTPHWLPEPRQHHPTANDRRQLKAGAFPPGWCA